MKELKLTPTQLKTLVGILKTEEVELKDIIAKEDDKKDLNSLNNGLINVQSILNQLID